MMYSKFSNRTADSAGDFVLNWRPDERLNLTIWDISIHQKLNHERKNPHQVANFSNYLFTIWNYFNRIYSELIRIENWERFQKIKFSKMKLAAWIFIGAQDCFLITISRSAWTNFSARWSLIMISFDFNTNWKWF